MKDYYAVIDLKSFYASCECAYRGLDPFLTPLVVADPERTEATIIMSATPYLKKLYKIPNVCRVKDIPKVENLILAQPRMANYVKTSAEVVSILLDFFDIEDIHVYSVDESFVYLTPYLSLYNTDPIGLVKMVQKRIRDELGLLSTAGIGPNMFMAKVCLDNEGKKKPPYYAIWNEEDVQKKLWKISPITAIWGINVGISSHLSRIGIRNLEQLAKAPISTLEREFGIIGLQLHDLANGIDVANIREKYVPKEKNLNIGQVLIRDYTKKGAKVVLREMCDDLCFRLRLTNQKVGCVALMVGYNSALHGGFSKQCSLDIASDNNDELWFTLSRLYDKYVLDAPIRNLGISFSKLRKYDYKQISLFENEFEGQSDKYYEAVDSIQKKYGKNAVLRMTSLLEDSTVKERHTQIGGHKA